MKKIISILLIVFILNSCNKERQQKIMEQVEQANSYENNLEIQQEQINKIIEKFDLFCKKNNINIDKLNNYEIKEIVDNIITNNQNASNLKDTSTYLGVMESMWICLGLWGAEYRDCYIKARTTQSH